MSNALGIFQGMRADLSPAEITALREDVGLHYQRLLDAQKKNELVAVDLALALHGRLDQLLAMAHLVDPESRASIVGAARYFVSSSDAKPDDLSCTGLDDDVEVFNHVARLLGRSDLFISDAE